MLNFFRKNNKVTNLAWLGVDMHSHILPGIDDGAPDVEIALHYVKSFENLGLHKLICTPHIYKDLYPNTKDTITKAKQKLQQAMDLSKVGVKLEASAEYMVDHDFSIEEEILPMGNNLILIEMSYLNETPNIMQRVFEIEIKGLTPILAHPERYQFYFKDKRNLRKFRERGCLMQLNLLSILGYYGKDVKACAEYLLKENMYDFAATDLHHDRHLKLLTDATHSGKLHDLLGVYGFKNQEVFGIK